MHSASPDDPVPGPHDLTGRLPNVGGADAVLRGVVALLVPLLAGWLIRRFDADWVVTLAIHGLLLTAYLALSAATRFDPLYALIDRTTFGTRAVRPHRGSGRAAL